MNRKKDNIFIKRHIISYAFVSLMFTGLFASCHDRDCEWSDWNNGNGSDVEVNFVYDYSSLDSVPKMMRLVIYPLDNQISSPIVRDFTDSLSIALPRGKYRVEAFNDDSGILRYSGYDNNNQIVMITTGHANATKTAILDTPTDSSFYDYPDIVDAARMLPVDAENVNGSRETTVHLQPTEATRHVHVYIQGMSNMSLLQGAEMSLDSCYINYYPAFNSTDSTTASVVTPNVTINAADSLITSSFNVFGITSSDNHTLRIALYGRNFSRVLSFNLKDKIERTEDGRDIYIRLHSNFDIGSLAPQGTGAFNVNIKGWSNDSTEIKL